MAFHYSIITKAHIVFLCPTYRCLMGQAAHFDSWPDTPKGQVELALPDYNSGLG